MTIVHELSRADARRIAVRAQAADQGAADRVCRDGPAALAAPARADQRDRAERRAGAVEPAGVVVRPARPVGRRRRAAADRAAPDGCGCPRTSRSSAPRWPSGPGAGELREWQEGARDWVRANNACRRDILERLRADGPLPASELPDTCVVPWGPAAGTTTGTSAMMLDKLVERGEVAAAGGTGRDRLWDLASRIYPDDPVPPVEEARRLLDAAAARRPGHRPCQGHHAPVRAGRCRRGGRARRGRGRPRAVARGPGPARPAVRRPRRAAVARSTGSSPTASG